MEVDVKTRTKEIAKLKKMGYSQTKLASDCKVDKGYRSYVKIAKALDINLDAIFDMITGKNHTLGYMLEDLNLAMIDTPGKPSSQMSECGELNTLADHCVTAYMQRLYTIGSRFPYHPLVATFTLSPIAGGTVFNPFSVPPAGVREEEKIEPEVDYTMFLAESWSTLDDTARLPFYKDNEGDRRKRKVTELGQIPILQFFFTEDAKAIYKYGIGIQWSFESAFREVRMQLLGTWVMRQAITDRIWMLQDAIGVGIDFAKDNSRTHTVPAGGNSGVWTWDKLDTYNYRWRVPYIYDHIIAEPNAISKFKKTDFGSDNWTLGHLAMLSDLFKTNYEDMRMNRKVKFIDLPDLEGEKENDDGTPVNNFGDNDYLMLKRSAGLGQVYNTGMTRDSMETIEGNQSYVRRFSMGTRFYGIHPKAFEWTTLG